jgi:hypothetical protein
MKNSSKRILLLLFKIVPVLFFLCEVYSDLYYYNALIFGIS